MNPFHQVLKIIKALFKNYRCKSAKVQCTFSIEETEFKVEMTNKITNLNAGSENFFEGGCVHHGKLKKKSMKKIKRGNENHSEKFTLTSD